MAMRGPRKLVLLHLSDIHLREGELASGQDLDEDIRSRLLADIPRCGLPDNAVVDAVLITGDLAFGGKEPEYKLARTWLQTLCAKVGCPESQVWVVPGNHDADRDALTKNASLRDMHTVIRKETDPAQALGDRLREEAGAQTLLLPFAAYNKFAEQYGCETTGESVFWESSDEEDDLILNDGSHLRLRGIHTAILSDKSGDNGPPKGPATEVVGIKQVQLRDEVEGICYLTLCHHPPEWLLDGDVVQDHLTSRARIQLFGHKHRQRVRRIDNSVVLGAGALHPSRGEADWQPRYNILRLEVREQASHRTLHVEVYQRAWKPGDTHFGKDVDADGKYPKTFEVALGPWSPPEPKGQGDAAAHVAGIAASAAPPPDNIVTPPIATKDLVFGLFAMSFPIRMQIFVRLGLLDDADTGITDGELIKRAIRRARVRNQLSDLAAAIEAARPKE